MGAFIKKFQFQLFLAIVVCHFLSHNNLFAQTTPQLTIRPITLDEVLKLTFENNLELQMVRKDSVIARENILNAKTYRTPSLAAGIYYNYIGNPVLFTDFYSNDSTIDYYHHQGGWNVVLGVPIFMGGKINTAIAQETTKSQIQNEILKMTAAQVKLTAINQFYTLYKLYKEVEIIELNISSIKTQIKQLQSKVANGQNLISDLSRTELQLSNFEINIFTKRNNIELVSTYLCTFTGLPTNEMLKPIDVLVQVPAEQFIYEACLKEAFDNRQELKQSELQKNSSELSLRMTRNALLPVITGSAIYNSEFPVPGTFPPRDDILNYWAAGVKLSYEISSLYNLNHQVKSDKLQVEKDDLNIQNIRNSISNEVKTAYVHFLESKKNVEAYQKNVELAELNYKIVKSKYDNDFALIIDMIDAEAQVGDARISLNNAIVDAIYQYYNLLYSMGKLN